MCRIKYIKLIVLGFLTYTQLLSGNIVNVDYSELVLQAEVHKNDVLKFLNSSSVQERYKSCYEQLLTEISTGRFIKY